MLGDFLKALLVSPWRAGRVKRAGAMFDAAMALQRSDDREGARRSLEQSLALDPDNAEAHRWLGAILAASDRTREAAARHLERALALNPHIENGWVELGIVYHLQGDYSRAVASFRAALEIDPDSLIARLNLGTALKEGGHTEEALVHLRQVYERSPEAEGALRGLVLALIDSDRCEEARAIAAAAARRQPSIGETHKYLGLAHQKLHDPEQALACYDAALAIRADDAEIHDNRGTALLEFGRVPEAIESYDRALALQPDHTLAAFHRALACLLLRDYRRGWDGYELRMLDRDYPKRPDVFPRWQGEPLAGRSLLLYREQGLGDEIMFASCLPQLVSACARCFIECEPRLLGLFQRSFPAATVFATASDGGLPREIAEQAIDFSIPMGSVPRLLRRDPADFPRHEGYLKADPQRVERWRSRLRQAGAGIQVGISWEGGVRKTRRALRSIPLDRWLPILQTTGARFVSLQYGGEAVAAVTALAEQHGIRVAHWAEAIEDYEETAALVCALDLVISVCTAVIHLAGACGRPVWIMAPYSPEWRYGFSGDTMPWYPSARVFRQPAFGEWGPVTESVAAELGRRAGAVAA